VILDRNVQVSGRDTDVRVACCVSDLGKRSPASQCVADEGVAPVMNRQRLEAIASNPMFARHHTIGW
jgi:hypothetical protein